MKKLLIILLVLLLLGGGGAAAWWFYFRTDPNAPPPPPAPPELSTLSIPVDQGDALVINVIKNGQSERRFYMRFTLMFDANEKREKTRELMPVLINDFNQELHGLLARKLVEESKFDRPLIEKQLQKLCERRLGPGVVSQVRIDNMEERKD